MDNLIIHGTNDTPFVDFNKNGILKFEGRAMPEHPLKFFKQLFEWVQAYCYSEVTLEMKLDYFNTAVSKSLLDFMKIIEKNASVKKVTVNWHYEEGDDDCYESGELFNDLLPEFTFNFHEFAEEEF